MSSAMWSTRMASGAMMHGMIAIKRATGDWRSPPPYRGRGRMLLFSLLLCCGMCGSSISEPTGSADVVSFGRELMTENLEVERRAQAAQDAIAQLGMTELATVDCSRHNDVLLEFVQSPLQDPNLYASANLHLLGGSLSTCNFIGNPAFGKVKSLRTYFANIGSAPAMLALDIVVDAGFLSFTFREAVALLYCARVQSR
jgi:hypothetical protein